MPDLKVTEVTHEITFSGQIVHGPEARALAAKIFAEQLRRYQEYGVNKGIDILQIITRKEGDPL